MIEKLDGMTKDIVKDNIAKLKELFPTIVKDNKIDFTELELLLGQDISRDKEQYSFVWNGKTEATKLAQKRSTGTLIPCKEESKNWDTTKNIYIEGDNLEVLKLLQSSYNGKIKMIYIDPPYNTGHDFVYKDNFEDNLANYKEITGQAQKSNADTDGRYHTNWLNMMYPRLKLARNLLTKDGVVFMSIDDNEVYNLKKLCDEIFGEDNFVANLIWKKKQGGGNDSTNFVIEHEYVLVYAKSIDDFNIKLDKNYVLDDNLYPYKDEKGDYGLITLDKSSIRFSQSLVFEITDKEGNKYYPRVVKGKQACWRWSRDKVEKEFDKLVFKNGNVYTKYYRPDGVPPRSLLTDSRFGRTETGKEEIVKLMEEATFSYPKPVELIEHFIALVVNPNDVVLDFFSGSGTTVQSIFNYNVLNDSNVKFVCVQLPENIEHQSYENLCEIAKERIRRAGDKIKSENPNATDLDVGFKVFKLDSSNLKKWNNAPTKDAEEVANRIRQISFDYLEDGRTEIDLVYEIMLKYGIDLTLPVTQTANGKGYIVNGEDYKLLVCSQMNIRLEDVEEFANESVGTYLFADRCFSDDNLLINTQEILKSKNKEMRLF